MKKAFEDNLPRVKPRVRFSVPVEGAPAQEATGSAENGSERVDIHAAVQSAAEAALLRRAGNTAGPCAGGRISRLPRQPLPHPFPSSGRAVCTAEELAPPARVPAEESPLPPARAGRTCANPVELSCRSACRRKLRNRLLAIQDQAAKTTAADNPGEVLAAAEGLALELNEARARASRFERELTRARADLSTAVAEAEAERQRVDAQQAQLAEARQLLTGLEAELSMLEEERDEVLTEVRGLRQADGARRDSLTALSQELDEARRGLAEARAEQVEIVRELEAGDIEGARLTHELKRVEGERARLLEELTELSSTKGELADSRRTLERVHQLLAVAATVKRK